MALGEGGDLSRPLGSGVLSPGSSAGPWGLAAVLVGRFLPPGLRPGSEDGEVDGADLDLGTREAMSGPWVPRQERRERPAEASCHRPGSHLVTARTGCGVH